MRRIIIFALLLLTSLNLVHAQDKANWTILHYTAVDNNLEGAAFNDYYEMQTVGSGEGVNIVTEFDRAEGFDKRFGDWTDTRRFFIQKSPPMPELDAAGKRDALLAYFVEQGYGDAESLKPQIDTLDDATVAKIFENKNVGVSFNQTAVQDLGEVDMGDPKSLTDFVVWGVQNYPANHYMIVIGSHGGGWRGIGPDDGGSSPSILELPEIDTALTDAQAQLGIKKFDIVGFDACLMGVTDVAVMLEPHADYVLFSQEVIPGNGWEYTKSIASMQANPNWDAFQVGSSFIDNYMAYYAGPGARTKVDLSLVETAGLPKLLAALQDFAKAVKANSVELLSALGTARNNSQTFGTSLGDRADAYSYVDLKDFMTWFSLQTTITEDAYHAAQEVIAAYDTTVVYSLADSKLPGATGMGVYLPSTPIFYDAYGTTYPQLAPSGFAFWQDYLKQFYSTIATSLDGSALQLDIKNVFTLGQTGSSVDTPVVFFDAAGKGVVDLSYSIMYVQQDGTRGLVDLAPISYNTTLPTGETVIEYPNELTPSTFNWSVEFPFVSDGKNKVLSLMQATSSSGSEGTVSGTYVNAQGSQPAYMVFDTSTNSYTGLLAVADNAPYEVQPQPGDQFIVDLYTLTADGKIETKPLTDIPLTFGVQPFTFNYEPASSGTYEVGLSMSDLAGNRIYKKVEVTVNNDGVDGSVRGYTDTNDGVHFQYPYAWGESYLISNDDGSVTNAISSDTGTQSVYVQTFADKDVSTALESALTTTGAEVGESDETTFGGLPAYGATYTRKTDDGTISGTAYSVINADSGSAVVFRLETTGDAQLNTDLASLMDASLKFFKPI